MDTIYDTCSGCGRSGWTDASCAGRLCRDCEETTCHDCDRTTCECDQHCPTCGARFRSEYEQTTGQCGSCLADACEAEADAWRAAAR